MHSDSQVTQSRAVERVLSGVQVTDGAGVKIVRLLDQSLQRRLDPFLMLDSFRSDARDDYIAGFPDHPHRGFETVTYLVAGRLRHRDSAGHEGVVESGGVQWMSAARGVIHSEMPEQEDGLMEGFQLWLNLPARDKMAAPWYRDIPAHRIPDFTTAQGVRARVIAGESHGVDGAVSRPVTEPLYLDVSLPAGGRFAQLLPARHNAFLVVYRGAVRVAGTEVGERQIAILSNDAESDGVVVSADEPARVLLAAGRPLGEPIVQHGPFVMNTAQEIRQAILDFQDGRLA